jgi:dolichol-phosphate mannosyltransferase
MPDAADAPRPTPPDAPERVLVVLPTYNERETLPLLVPRVLAQRSGLDVLIVDDGSPDGTGALADAMAAHDARIHVIHRPGKRGLGTAYIAGFRWALERDYRYVLEMDADFSHEPERIPALLDAARTFDLVLGSRYLGGVRVLNWPMSRLLLSYFANAYARIATGMPFTDSTSGFKCYRREVLQRIELDAIRSEGYAFQIETTLRARRCGFRVGEVEIVFAERAGGTSKLTGRIVLEAVWRVWQLRVLDLLGRL